MIFPVGFQKGGSWMSSKAIEQEKTFQIGRCEGPAFMAVIVGRDFVSSGLLTDALVRSLRCDAVAV